MRSINLRGIAVLLVLLISSLAIGQEAPSLSKDAQTQGPEQKFEPFSGKCIGVTDGDTITVLKEEATVKVRLHGIDCPESGQAFGDKAKRFTSELCFGKPVIVAVTDKDQYGRLVGVVVLKDGRILNQELVQAGFAWWYREYAPHDNVLPALETGAKEAKAGLWADKNSMPPWEYRHEPTTPLETKVTLAAPYPQSYNGAPTDKISVQYAVMAVLDQAGLKYNWQQSSKNADPARRQWITPDIHNKPVGEALQEILAPVGLGYELRGNEVVLTALKPIDNSPPRPIQQAPRRTPERTTSAPAFKPIPKVESPDETNTDTTVYITRTGKKYHRGGCRYLSKSKIPISLKDAKARGYTPCSVCKP